MLILLPVPGAARYQVAMAEPLTIDTCKLTKTLAISPILKDTFKIGDIVTVELKQGTAFPVAKLPQH
jgi:hypothetical protein